MSKHSNEAVEGDDGGLVICRGCKTRGTYAEPPSGECPAPYKPERVLLAESLAREKALQLHLNAADQRIDELTQSKAEPETVWCACGDGHAANSYGAGFMAANSGVCENCDAAKPRVESSHEIPGTSGMRLNMLATQGE
ncbi:hypothetical protein LOY55_10790 [Pseudomonas sp. B21-040]|uniref:hypothetical protein n=1 Tax=Pseudomonas sp. B21-040 TaxID=2895486 RepID=UPI00215F14D2|nr:hypothetical protein [Pseudomonas sp. B21-040]UVL42549.1 hypothetical protein LOY55_10790 [Pseudomonas sp. B21-040]